MKKIFAALAIMSMAAAGVSYAQAYDGKTANSQTNIEYKYHNDNCGYNHHGHHGRGNGYHGHGGC